jgi:hypothetical protein
MARLWRGRKGNPRVKWAVPESLVTFFQHLECGNSQGSILA